jgi:hypothetical protein
MNGDLSGEAASVPQPAGVDEQISTLLQGLEAELKQGSPPRQGGPPPTSSQTVGHERPTKSTLDREPRTRARRPRRRAMGKGRGLGRSRAHRRIHRPLVDDPVAQENVFLIIVAVMIGIGVGLAIPLLIR